MQTRLIALLLCSSPLFAGSPAVALLQQADTAYAERSDLSKAQDALNHYQKAVEIDPGNVEACWKTSRVAWWLGDHAVSRADKLSYFQKGVDYAKQALKQDPNSVEGHFWLAGSLGSLGETKGVLKSLFLVKPIRQEMAEVIRLNERYDGGGGYRVLGVVDYKVPGFAGGSKKRALENLNKALAIDPLDPFTHFYLAEYYLTVGNKEKMREEWAILKSLKVPNDLQPEHAMLLRKGEKLFAK